MKSQWQRYGDVWSLSDDRDDALRAVVSEKVIYRDPTSKRSGIAEFSQYMADFQSNVPGGRFVIGNTMEHSGRTLGHWSLLNADGSTLQNGISFALIGSDGKFSEVTGFFLAADAQNDGENS